MTSSPNIKEAEDVTVYIGEIGRYQWRVFIVVFILTIFTTDSIHIVFIGADMDHWCHVPELDSLPAGVQKNLSIPAVERSEDGGVLEYSKCEMYARNYSYYVLYNDSQFVVSNDSNTDDIVSCKHGWIYDTSQFQSTIVKKFNLVCDLSFLKPFVSTVYMLGILLGSASSGALSDRFGRKKIMITYCLIKIVGILMSILSSNYITFAIGRLLMGCGMVGYALPSFVLVMELVGRRYRTVLGTSLQIAFSVGYMLQPVVAYFLRDELTFQVAVCSPVLLFPFLMFFLLPESPRWLVIHGKFDEVTKLVEKICETNNRQLSKHFNPTNLLQQRQDIEKKNCSALLTSPVMRIRTFVIDFSWFTCSLVYNALSLNVGTLHGNIYINTFISGAVEVPAYILCVLMMDWKVLGRRLTGCIGLVGAGLSAFLCIPMILYEFSDATVVLAMFGKAFISVAYSVVYIYANELFPTEVRNVAMGTASMFSRLSAMMAHYVGGPLSIVWQPLPSLLFGVCSTVSGLSYLFLPETLGQQLPDTIQQAEQRVDSPTNCTMCPDDVTSTENSSQRTSDVTTDVSGSETGKSLSEPLDMFDTKF